jgi:hypothetical protein
MNFKPSFFAITRIGSILVSLIILLTSTAAVAASVTLRWDPNDPAPDGYRVFARQSGQAYDYSRPNWEGSATACVIGTLADRTDYYFVVRAFDGSLVSADSEEVHYTPQLSPDPTPLRDDDNDGLPDDWESHFGLDPAVDDADGDLDGDGISNRDEYRTGQDPNHPGIGTAPLPPVPLNLKSDALAKANPILELGTFADADGDTHIATQWQIFDTHSGDCLFDAITDRRLTDLKVPFLLLKGNTRCYWRARFFDSGGKVSPWSSNSDFTTAAAGNDLNGNNIPDDREDAGLTAEGFHALLSTAALGCVPTGIRAASEDTIAAIEQVLLVDPVTFDMDENTPDQLPLEMVAYKLILYQPGQQARVTIQLSDPAPAGATWVKYDEINGWQDYSDQVELAADRRSVTVAVKDGGYGDADGIANRIIIDPLGLSLVVDGSSSTAGAGGGGGGGCFIGTLHP